MTDSRSSARIGLACAGGVVEGAFYEIGVLCALDEAIEGLDLNALHIYVGVSAGAIITACLANGIPPRTIARALASSDEADFGLPPEKVFKPALGHYAERGWRVPATVLGSVRRRLRRPGDLSLFGALMELAQSLPVGLFDNTPLERHLARLFATEGHTNDFRELPAMLRIIAVNLDTAELVAFGDPATAHVPISRAVQASTALPLLYCPVRIDGEYYIDGVARRTVNASRALKEGVDLLLCVNPIVPIDLRVVGAKEHESLVDSGLPAVLSQTFRTVIHSRRIAGFRNYEYAHPEADVLIFEPEEGDPSMFFSSIFSFSNRHAVIEHGYASTRGHLLRHEERLARVFRRHGLGLRGDVLREPRTLVPDDRPGGTKTVLRETGQVLDRLEAALRRLGVDAA